MTLNDLKKKVRDLLTNGKLQEAIKKLEEHLAETAKEERDFCTGQLSRYKTLKNEYDNGVIGEEYFRTTENTIRQAVINRLNDLTPELLRLPNSAQKDQIYALLSQINFPTLKIADLVDCNRDAPFKAYRTGFGRGRKLGSQFHFIAGCPNQKPDSLAERIIYDLRDGFLKGASDALFYQPADFPLTKAWAIPRIEVAPLPFEIYHSLEENQASMADYFATAFPKFFQPSDALQSLLSQQGKIPQFRIITLAFLVDTDDYGWPEELTQYLDWIMETFKANAGIEPQFQFLFVVQAQNIHRAQRDEINKALAYLKTKHNSDEKEFCLSFDPLLPANDQDLTRWFSRRTKNLFPSEIQDIVGYFAEENTFDMNAIETFFIDLYKYTHQSQ